jgi:hypothetical protein
MNGLRCGFLGFIVACLLGNLCAAQQTSPPASIWAEWEGDPAERYGPDVASGVFLYFHGSRPAARSSNRISVLALFAEMAKAAKWDILRIDRSPQSDYEADDGRILQFTAEQVAQARREGYKRVYVGGVSRGGWLALSSAQLPGIDGVVGLTPGTSLLNAASLDRQAEELARRVSDAKAKRVAAVLLEGDPREYVQGGRGAILRKALERTTSRFMIVDRPPGLLGHHAVGKGRFVRRYRDCLLQFLLFETLGPGEDVCSASNGYAAGAEIGFPKVEPLMSLPSGVDRRFAHFLGRWEGDDETGAYVIAQSVAADAESITFLHGYSPAPGSRTTPWLRGLRFRFDRNRAQIISRMLAAGYVFALMPFSADELEHDVAHGSTGGVEKFLLRNPKSSRKW